MDACKAPVPKKLCIDAQLLMDAEKTGIGWTAKKLLEQLINLTGGDNIILNYFTLHRSKSQLDAVRSYKSCGVRLNECRFFVQRLYKAIWRFIPLPYSFFYGSKADISLFFNYCVPPGVKGKSVAFVYDMVYKSFPETMDWKTRAMLETNMKSTVKRADLIVTISEFSKCEILKNLDFPEGKIAIVPCGVDDVVYHPGYPAEDISAVLARYGISGKYFLYLGTLEPRKNIIRLVEAYNILTKKISDCPPLVIAGKKGWLFDDIFNLVTNLNLESKIIFTGYVASGDVPILMSAAQVFIFPSLYEGFGMPPLEAMACGTPVIASDIPAIREVTGDAALLVDPYSQEDIAGAMKKLCNDDALCRELSVKGLNRCKFFSWRNSGEKLVEALRSL